MTTDPFTHTTAIVTGASRGFGRATAIRLASRGAHVVGVARDGAALAVLEGELRGSFTPVVADVADEALAPRLIAEHQPQLLVLNAGATPHAAPIDQQSWETFSRNWEVDVRQVFEFTRAALRAPMPSGSTVISVSSGAARAGSPLSGGYAGAKATVGFISDYAGSESDQRGLGIGFVSLLPKLTPATGLGSTFVAAYADRAGVDRDAYLAELGPALAPEGVADAVITLAGAGRSARQGSRYLVTAAGVEAIG